MFLQKKPPKNNNNSVPFKGLHYSSIGLSLPEPSIPERPEEENQQSINVPRGEVRPTPHVLIQRGGQVVRSPPPPPPQKAQIYGFS